MLLDAGTMMVNEADGFWAGGGEGGRMKCQNVTVLHQAGWVHSLYTALGSNVYHGTTVLPNPWWMPPGQKLSLSYSTPCVAPYIAWHVKGTHIFGAE